MKFKCLYSIYLCLFLFAGFSASAKEFDKEYFKTNLQTKVYALDTEASAIVLYENIYDHIAFENNTFKKKEIVRKIIKILKPEATSLGDIHIYYTQYLVKSSSSFKGTTYNLKGDEVVSTEVAGQDMMKKSAREYSFVMNFAMPAVKEGSIIDYSYEVISTYDDETLTWEIQDEYPKLISEFSVTFPKMVEFTTISHTRFESKEHAVEDEAEKANDTFSFVKRTYENSVKTWWMRTNVPGIKKESFVVNRENQLERLEMQESGIHSGLQMHNFSNTWKKVNDALWVGDKAMKKSIADTKGIYDVILDSLTTNEMSAVDKASVIFNYVRSNFKVDERNRYYLYDLRDALITKKGTANEIVLTLVAMLQRAGVSAHPIIMSTTSKVSPSENFPVLDRLNYMACAVSIDSSYILLDATDKNNSFGLLPSYCYNGFSWIIGDEGVGIYLTPDAIKDKTIFNIKMSDFTDSSAKLELTEKFGMMKSVAIRKNWVEEKVKSKDKLNDLKQRLPSGIEVVSSTIENENNPDANLIIKQTCTMPFEKNVDNFFLNANLVKLFEKNPFTEINRKLLIEFPYKKEEAFYMNITLPKNLQPDTTYAPLIINYNNDALSYKKIITYLPEMNILTVNSIYTVNNTIFDPSEYPAIKDFFQKIVDDNNQVLVLKKTKK